MTVTPDQVKAIGADTHLTEQHDLSTSPATAALREPRGNRNTGLRPRESRPAWVVAACVGEARRAKELGLRGVTLTSDPQDQGAPDLANAAWDPLWETCSSLELPVHFHIGASLTTMTYFDNYPWPSHDDDTKLAIGGALLFLGDPRGGGNTICPGLPARVPPPKIESVARGPG